MTLAAVGKAESGRVYGLWFMVYGLLKKFPKEEQYALCDQLRRAAVSVTSNIAEGTNRTSYPDKVHFLEMSYGSLMEVHSQMDVSCDLGYITPEELSHIVRNLQYIGGLFVI